MVGKLNIILINTMLAIFCALMLFWASFSYRPATQNITDKVGAALYYPEFPALELRYLVRTASNWVMERKSLQDRAAELERENLALRAAFQREMIKIPEGRPDMIDARVTLRYPEAWWKEIRVNKGTRHGVQGGAPALADGFLIGRVSRASDDYSWVELITSSSFLIAAIVDDTWDLGVINGDDKGNIWLLYTPADKDFTRGMTVSTALVGDYFPPGIPIGQVWGQGEARDGFVPLRVASGAHFTQLYTLQILRTGSGGAR
ncbi:rod shape-determining protein MreC [Synergistales bacterium]|nr:rod shape-determining protein MreC [Synergistales bacterium]